MAFPSIEYFLFLSIVFILYWTLCRSNKSLQNALLVLSSATFYGWWDWRFLGLLLFTTLSTYFAGLLMCKYPDKVKRVTTLVVSVVVNLVILLFFKYYNFFIESLTDALSLVGICLSTSTLKIILPIGISFYTFSALSYVIDVYQGKIEPTKDILAYMAYVMFFPSILSGPINRAQKQLPQYYQLRKFDYNIAIDACQMILWGMVMKLCLADRLGIYVDTVYSNIAQHNGTTLFFTSILYTIQIYADFAGYSLIAIGSGKLFGVNLCTNFLRPYFSTTITDFWRRWHISLTTWFRDYIYFPLGGNRCSKTRWIINTLIVFVISGLWHGAAYAFLVWGILHGVGMLIERIIYGNKLKNMQSTPSFGNAVRWFITFMFVNLAWIPFRVNDFHDIKVVICKIITDYGSLYMEKNTLLMAFIAFVIVLVNDLSEEYNWRIHLLRSKYGIVKYITAIVLICYIIAFGVLNGGSFIYFQF